MLTSKRPVTLRPEYASKYNVYAGVEAGFVFVSFNMDFPELGYNPDPERERRNKALRCAIIKGFDWQGWNTSWYNGIGELFPGIIVPASPNSIPNCRAPVSPATSPPPRISSRTIGWTTENLPTIFYGSVGGATERLIFEQFRAWMREIGFPARRSRRRPRPRLATSRGPGSAASCRWS